MKFGIPASKRAEDRLYDSSCTEVDEDVFSEEVLKQPNLGVFLLRFENSSHGNISFGFFKHLHEHLTVSFMTRYLQMLFKLETSDKLRLNKFLLLKQ